MCSLVLLLIISLQLVASCSKYLPSLLVLTSLVHISFASLQKLCKGNFGKFHGSGKNRFGGFEKDCYLLKIPKRQLKHVQNYKRAKLVSCFLNNAAKTCLYGLKFQRTLKLNMSKAFFHFSGNLYYTSCLSTFKHNVNYCCLLSMANPYNLQIFYSINKLEMLNHFHIQMY